MSRRVLLAVLVAALLAVPLGIAYADDETPQTRLVQIRGQIMELRREMVREMARAGMITEGEAAMILDRMERAFALRQEVGSSFPEGRLRGFGPRLRGRFGEGWPPCQNAPAAPGD